ncbi:PhnA domain-containing protein [Neptunicella marina]|uniref:PhnA domain-containing protein n=1 Tax=Neptunicella marina TaxID=2125989 RepID=A0A8J6IRB0_9ALTE|nr:alkylphosphonate utilization protein [Neptunicella marina]MBC3764385.1 PhnA domain-containing protein [Neptunicella marina]
MSVNPVLLERSGHKCELCSSEQNLSSYELPASGDRTDCQVVVCETCLAQIEGNKDMDANHWRCLNDSMWSPVLPVQILSWRLLKKLSNSEMWAQDQLEMMYLEDDDKAWAEAGAYSDDSIVHKDSNGAVLKAGDTVTIIKDLNVKGTSFVAKRGTAVRGIGLTDNPEHIEGRVNGTRIVILTQYVKKSS